MDSKGGNYAVQEVNDTNAVVGDNWLDILSIKYKFIKNISMVIVIFFFLI